MQIKKRIQSLFTQRSKQMNKVIVCQQNLDKYNQMILLVALKQHLKKRQQLMKQQAKQAKQAKKDALDQLRQQKKQQKGEKLAQKKSKQVLQNRIQDNQTIETQSNTQRLVEINSTLSYPDSLPQQQPIQEEQQVSQQNLQQITQVCQETLNDILNQLEQQQNGFHCIFNKFHKCDCHQQNNHQFMVKQIQQPFVEKLTQIPQDGIVDVTYNYKSQTLNIIKMDGKLVKIPSQHIQLKVSKTPIQRTESPVIKIDQSQLKLISVKDYRCSGLNAQQYYGEANSGSEQEKLLLKIIHDNNIQCSCQNIQKIYYDIETYNELDFDSVPQFKFHQSHIGMICYVREYFDQISNCYQLEKVCLLNNENQYDVSNVDKDIKILHYQNEQLTCQAFFDYLAQQPPTIILGFNSSCNMFFKPDQENTSGYDLPFIINRSRMNITVQERNNNNRSNSQIQPYKQYITKIDQLPNIYISDYNKLLSELYQSSCKDLKNKKLESWLEYFKLPSKNDHNYIDLQMRLSKYRSSISDIINYCVQDCNVLSLLEDKTQCIGQLLADQKINKNPLQFVLHKSIQSQLTQYMQQVYVNNGCLVCYTQFDVEKRSVKAYRGALCTQTEGTECKIIKNVIQPDVNSQYPNSFIANNMDYLTIRNNYQDEIELITVDVCDDDNRQQDQYYFTKDKAILSELCQQYINERKKIKTLMKNSKDDIEFMMLNNTQIALKKAVNTMYGITGYQNGLLCDIRLAMCCTAYGRKSIQLVNNYLQSKDCILLANDTDSATVQLPQQISNYDQVMQLIKDLNQYLVDQLNVNNMIVAIEEIFTHFMNVDGKKNYAALYLDEQDCKQWSNEYIDQGINQDKLKLKIKGVSYISMSIEFQQIFKDIIINCLKTSDDVNLYCNEQIQIITDSIKKCIRECNIEELAIYCRRVRPTGKQFIHQLLQQYDFVDNYIPVIHKMGSQLKSERQFPLQLLSKQELSLIDIDELVESSTQQLRKFLLMRNNRNQKIFRQKYDEILEELIPGNIFVRFEKISNQGIIRHEQGQICIQQLQTYWKQKQNVVIHETIIKNKIRLIFDIDDSKQFDLEFKIIQDVLRLFTEINPELISIQTTGNKQKYRVYTRLCVTLQFAKYIGIEINKRCQKQLNCEYNLIDISVYKKQGNLRIINCKKIEKNSEGNPCLIDRQYRVEQNQDLYKFLMTDQTNTVFISQPLSLMDDYPLDEHLILKDKYEEYQEIHEKKIHQYLVNNNISYQRLQQSSVKNIVNIVLNGKHYCDHHKKYHDRENLYAIINKTKIKIMCRVKYDRLDKPLLAELDYKYPVEKQQLSKLEMAIEQQDQHKQYIEDAIITNNQYFNTPQIISTLNKTITYIQSSLGSGKTKFTEDMMKLYKTNILCLSARKTYTQSASIRFGINNYLDIQGLLNLDEDNFICQVESLDRVRGTPKLLIIDEVESIFNQLTSNFNNGNKFKDSFIDLIQRSEKIIVSDGFLQQKTIDVINGIKNSDYQSYQNLYKPYADKTMIIKPVKMKDKDQIAEQILDYLNQGLKVVASITSIKLLQSIVDCVNKSMDKKIIYYTSNDTEKDQGQMLQYERKKQQFADVNKSWKEADLLIYTSTLTAGVDFQEEHFDVGVHYYCHDTCDPLSFVQGLHRVRKLSKSVHYIYMDQQYNNYSTTPSSLIENKYQHCIFNSQSDQLSIYLKARKKTLFANREQILVQCLSQLGYDIQYNANIYNPDQNYDFKFINDPNVDYSVQITQQSIDNFKILDKNINKCVNMELDDNYTQQSNKIKLLLCCGVPYAQLLDPMFDEPDIIQQIVHARDKIRKYNKSIKLGSEIQTIRQSFDNEFQRRYRNDLHRDMTFQLNETKEIIVDQTIANNILGIIENLIGQNKNDHITNDQLMNINLKDIVKSKKILDTRAKILNKINQYLQVFGKELQSNVSGYTNKKRQYNYTISNYVQVLSNKIKGQ